MYQPMLYLHWKQIRFGLIPFVLASFGLPVLMVGGAGAPAGTEPIYAAYQLIRSMQPWLIFYPVLAGAIGSVLALSAWNWDHKVDHVYALSLPLTRRDYALLKMGAGAALALLPAAALWIGAHVAAASLALPEGLHAYPNQLAFRFLLATLLSYAVLFAMAAGTIRTTLWVVSAAVGFLVFGAVVSGVYEMVFGLGGSTNLALRVLAWLGRVPGPFEVFTGNWALIDV